MAEKKTTEPDNTAVRTALWRALHLQVDTKPHIIQDDIGLKLISPSNGWQERPDMKFTKRLRASIIARARFVDDLVTEQFRQGIDQYIILGAGLDSFAQRKKDIASQLKIFEIDEPATLEWKKQRLIETGFGVPNNLHFVPVDFEAGSWWKGLLKAGYDSTRPAVVACTGVSLYLSKEAIVATLKQIAELPQGSTLAMTFYLPIDLLDDEDKPMQEIAEKGAREAGTPFQSFFTPNEILALAKEAGFKEAKTISTKEMRQLISETGPTDLFPQAEKCF